MNHLSFSKTFQFLFLLSFILKTEIIFPEEEKYHWPVQGEKMITGSFGEFRAYYFHLGLDLATEGKIGIPILAMTDSKLFRVQSLRYSIGNAILLKQKDGIVARYGHMSRFSDKIVNSLKPEFQTKIIYREDFEYNIPEVEAIEIKKGEVIGYSGDTGIGPAHLHVELMKDGYYINTASKLDIPELGTRIEVGALEVIPEDNQSFINGKNHLYKIPLARDGNNFSTNPIHLKGTMSFRLNATEATGRGNRIGFQRLSISLNQKLLQEFSFDFIQTNEVNRSCFILDNYRSNMSGRPFRYYFHNRMENALENFKVKAKNSGLINDKMLSDKENIVSLEVQGLGGKLVVFKIPVIRDTKEYLEKSNNIEKSPNISPNVELRIGTEDGLASVSFDKESVFSEEQFSFFKSKESEIDEEGMIPITPIYSIKPVYLEFNKGFDLTIQISDPKLLVWGKLGLYMITERGKIIRHISQATQSKTLFYTKSKLTGNFIILSDQSAPKISIVKYKENHRFPNSNFRIFLKVKDIGTGVPDSQFKAKIDDLDAKLDHDPEKGTFEIFYPEIIYTKGKHKITATATDRVGNVSEQFQFNYTVD
ncbi:MAG: hypothetical protein SFU98_00590 [Leptospiraceae bacterium]|nr:hypothetical protein [Leptospiraceae bacterium]